MIFMFPVERWWGTYPVFFSLFVAWLYATYFIYKYFIVPNLFHGRRLRLYALVAMVFSLGITLLFSSYKITSPFYHQWQHKEMELAIHSWGVRLNQQAIWLHYILVVIFCCAVGMQRIHEIHPEIVFLDIELNGVSGVELARQLPPACCLIFTTAYAHYALEGFEVNAVDFLHKPYFYERFNRAIQKAEQWLRMHDLLRAADADTRQLILKSDYKNVAIPIDTICYIESIDNYVKAHLTDGSTVLSKITLRSVEEQLPQGEFIRIHRSFVVPRSRILSFTRTEVTLSKCNKTLPIGKKYVDQVMKLLA